MCEVGANTPQNSRPPPVTPTSRPIRVIVPEYWWVCPSFDRKTHRMCCLEPTSSPTLVPVWQVRPPTRTFDVCADAGTATARKAQAVIDQSVFDMIPPLNETVVLVESPIRTDRQPGHDPSGESRRHTGHLSQG